MQYLAAHELNICVEVSFISLFPWIQVSLKVQYLAAHEPMVSVEVSSASLFSQIQVSFHEYMSLFRFSILLRTNLEVCVEVSFLSLFSPI